ncbi:hypothetical protein JXR01_03310 [Candidatus Kaiserbacteria bacterium]|nr:MAG: hypothetical protein JXR01_03310 [Candidatus Kaiserbacteria bacterium]
MDLSKLRIGNSAGDVKRVEEVQKLSQAPITHLVLGSITREQRSGNEGNTFWVSPDGSYALNARGLPSPGIAYYKKNGAQIANIVHAGNTPKKLIVSIAATQSNDDWQILAACAAGFADGIEINISCPNKWKNGKRERIVAEDPVAVSTIISQVRDSVPSRYPLSVKVPPFLDLQNEGSVYFEMIDVFKQHVSSVQEIVSCNTLGGVSTVIDGEKILSVSEGGKSGPAIKEWSKLQVRSLVDALPQHRIIGVGGIQSAVDVREYLNAGASGVQIGTHFFQFGPRVFEDILGDLA